MIWYHFLVCSLIVGSAVSSQQGRRNGNGATFSPVRELGPSLAASVAGGTIIAARSPLRPSLPRNGDGAISPTDGEVDDNDDECIVVLFRSPMSESESGSSTKHKISDVGNLTVSSVFGHQADDGSNCINSNDQQNNYYSGLSFLPNGPVNFPFLPTSSSNNIRILHAPSGLLVAATGFAPDADHILNVAAGRVFSRISVFDAPSPTSSTSSKSVCPHRLVREDLSSMMIDSALSEGGRPLGLQLLVVGQTSLSQRRARNDCPLEIYTIDPSGGYRSCVGKGTVVGRGAERVRSSLLPSTTQKSGIDTDTTPLASINVPHGWRGALDRAMMAAVDALEQDVDSNNYVDAQRKDSMAKYGAVVIFANSQRLKSQVSTSRCASVSSNVIEECYNRCVDEFRNLKMAK